MNPDYRARGRYGTNEGKSFEHREVSSKGVELMRPQIFTWLSEIILEDKAPAALLALSSGLIGIYLRFYQFSFAVLRLMQ